MYFHSICSIIVKFEGAFKDLAMKHKEVKLLVHLLFNSWVSFFKVDHNVPDNTLLFGSKFALDGFNLN